MIAVKLLVLLLGLLVVGLLWALDRPEDLGKVTPGWLRRHHEGQR